MLKTCFMLKTSFYVKNIFKNCKKMQLEKRIQNIYKQYDTRYVQKSTSVHRKD